MVGIEMKYHQTDKVFNENINKYGCLFFSMMDIAEEFTGHNFIIKTINKLYSECIDLGIMRNDCYILNHEKVLQQALENFECHDKVSYIGAKYLHKLGSWGEFTGMFLILQMRTQRGNGHFMRPHYDPYLPKIKFVNQLSVRYYNIGV